MKKNLLIAICAIACACSSPKKQVKSAAKTTDAKKSEATATTATSNKKKPNVLFIIADDLTAQAVSAYENKECNTPNIDQLASQGTLYTKAYCNFPVCGPSRASLMTGYYPSATNLYGYSSGRKQIGNQRKMWAEHFKDNGYYTARISKIFHMGVPIDIYEGNDGTDDANCWTESFNSKGPEVWAKGEGELCQDNPDGTKPIVLGNKMAVVKAYGDDLIHSDGKTAQKAIELIKEHKNEPFFLAVGFVRPHVPFVAPRTYFDPFPFESINIEKVENDWDDLPKKGENYVNSRKNQITPVQEKKAKAGYYASVAYMDAQVGKVLNTLKEEGLEDNTIVIFTSDHGFHLGEHDFWMKVSVHEESARVPFIIKVPGQKPTVCNSFTELVDLYPTTAALAGLEVPKNIQGKDLSKTITNPETKVRDMAFTVTQGGKTYLLRTDKYAFIQYGLKGEHGFELFDMEKDPKQYTNLAKKAEYKTVMQDFKLKLKQRLKEVRTNDLGIDYTVVAKKKRKKNKHH